MSSSSSTPASSSSLMASIFGDSTTTTTTTLVNDNDNNSQESTNEKEADDNNQPTNNTNETNTHKKKKSKATKENAADTTTPSLSSSVAPSWSSLFDTPAPQPPQNSNDDNNNNDQKNKSTKKRPRTLSSEDATTPSHKEEEDTIMTDSKPSSTLDSTSTDQETEEDSSSVDERTVFLGNVPLGFTRKSLTQWILQQTRKNREDNNDDKNDDNDNSPEVLPPPLRIASIRLRSIATNTDGVKVSTSQNWGIVQKVAVTTAQVNAHTKASMSAYVVLAHDNVNAETIAQWKRQLLQLDNTVVADPTNPTHTRTLRVDGIISSSSDSRTNNKPDWDASRSVFVGNLPHVQTDEEEIRRLFVEHLQLTLSPTDISQVRIVRDAHTQVCQGFGYVSFATKALVAQALRTMHGVVYHKRPLRVLVCQPQTNKHKKKPRQRNNNNNKDNHKMTTTAPESSANTSNANNKKNTNNKSSHSKASSVPPAVAALRRIVAKEHHNQHSSKSAALKRRPRGVNHHSNKGGPKQSAVGVSRKRVAQAKTTHRARKLQKRLQQGMGKTKSSKQRHGSAR